MPSDAQRSGPGPDFIVRYRWLPDVAAAQAPFQHMRCDFRYADDPPGAGLHMIHPEFLDADGVPLPSTAPVPHAGTAAMRVRMPQQRTVHRERIREGVKAWLVLGARALAEVEVVRVVGLHVEPTA